MDKQYNGYRNYITYIISFEITNNKKIYGEIMTKISADTQQCIKYGGCIDNLIESIQEFIIDIIDTKLDWNKNSIQSELLNIAYNEIFFKEIAINLVQKYLNEDN